MRVVSFDAAQRVLHDARVERPRDVHVHAIAARHGAMTLYGPVSTSRASIVRAGKRAVIRLDERDRGTPRERFTVAHELEHHVMHDVDDHFEQCRGEGKREGRAWQIEVEANDFARELLAPRWLALPLCTSMSPTLDDVERFARTFQLSLEAAVIRYVELAHAAGVPCAAALSVDGVIKWAPETHAFPGKIIRWRKLHPASAAARILARARKSGDGEPREVIGDAWRSPAPLVEHAVRLADRTVLSFVVAPG